MAARLASTDEALRVGKILANTEGARSVLWAGLNRQAECCMALELVSTPRYQDHPNNGIGVSNTNTNV